MTDEKSVTWRYENYSAQGELVLNEVDVDAETAEALDRGEAVTTFRPLAHRRFEGDEARARMEAWYAEIQRGRG